MSATPGEMHGGVIRLPLGRGHGGQSPRPLIDLGSCMCFCVGLSPVVICGKRPPHESGPGTASPPAELAWNALSSLLLVRSRGLAAADTGYCCAFAFYHQPQVLVPAPAEAHALGCGCEIDPLDVSVEKNDPIKEHYRKKKGWEAVASLFGSKKTMYCHHLTADGLFGVHHARAIGVTPTSADEVWRCLGKGPCCGRFVYSHYKGALVCGGLTPGDHDRTCNAETCLFIASGLECPVPAWAFK